MVTCSECEEEFIQIGQHWRYKPEHRPIITEKQKEVIKGLLMGDGSLNRTAPTPYIQVNMTSENYLKYVDNIFGTLSTGVSLMHTAEESARHDRKSGFNDSASAENYSSVYHWQTRSHPQFSNYESWYTSSGRIWPESIKLTPTALKHWYCGDGHFDNHGDKHSIDFAISNEIENTEKVTKIFTQSGLPSPSNYKTSSRKDGSMRCTARFTKRDSEVLWEYMGDPLPDFQYKWPERYQ